MTNRRCEPDNNGGILKEPQLTRKQLLVTAGVGIAATALPQRVLAEGTSKSWPGVQTYQYYPAVAGTYTTESIPDIMNMLDTIEHLLITVSTTAFTTGHLTLDGPSMQTMQSQLAANVYHSDFLEAFGAGSLSATFSTLPATLTDGVTFLRGSELVNSIAVSAYMTAAREFAELGQPTLVKNMYQLGAVHAEHRAIARVLLTTAGAPGKTPAANKAFETDYFVYVRDAYTFLQGLGAIGSAPVPTVMTYPGRAAALVASGLSVSSIIQRSPNNASISTTLAQGPRSVYAERGDAP